MTLFAVLGRKLKRPAVGARSFSTFTSYIDSGVIYLNVTNQNNSSPLYSLLGSGYRLKQTVPSPLHSINSTSSPDDIVSFVEHAYESETNSPVDIVFDNIIGEPTLELDNIVTIGNLIKERRHGVPLTVHTNGLLGANAAETLFKMDPGDNTGLRNLHFSVFLPAANPPQYSNIMKNTDASSFGAVMSFLVKAIELLGGEYVSCTLLNLFLSIYCSAIRTNTLTYAISCCFSFSLTLGKTINRPGVDVNAIRSLTTSLGVSNLEVVPYNNTTLYDVLGLEDANSNVTTAEIKSAYHNLAKELHPDKHVGKNEDELQQLEAKFNDITKAYEILMDGEQRKLYDQGDWSYISSKICKTT